MGIYPREFKVDKIFCTFMLTAMLLHELRSINDPKSPSNRSESIVWSRSSLGHRILFGPKQEEGSTCVTTRMDIEDVMLNEISQNRKDKRSSLPLAQVLGGDKFLETEGRMVSSEAGEDDEVA